MRIERWSIGVLDPYTPPELQAKSLSGEVYGHPRFDDGDKITTSAIVGVRDGRIVTRSVSEYELGEPHPEYEAAYPNAKQRALLCRPSNLLGKAMEIGTITAYGEELRLVLGRYQNLRAAIRLESLLGDPWGVLTVNLPEVPLGKGELLVKTYGENEPLRAPALASGLFQDTERRVKVGYAEVEVWKRITH